MSRSVPGDEAEGVARLGVPMRVFRLNGRSMLWHHLLAAGTCLLGAVLLAAGLRMLLADWPRGWGDAAFILAVGGLLLWGGIVLVGDARRQGRVRVAVYPEGLSWTDGRTSLACRWAQVAGLRGKVYRVFENTSVAIGGIPIPGTAERTELGTSHHITVKRDDGVELVFTGELEDIDELSRIIYENAPRTPAS